MMRRAWVLMTAMPPTKGHLDLVRFAMEVADDHAVEIIVCTQPGEPFVWERVTAITEEFIEIPFVHITHIHETLPQNPETTPGFQEMWNRILHRHGARPGDYVVASEPYGIWLAQAINGTFIPYDPDRSLRPIKAEQVRKSPIQTFAQIAPRFQHNLRTDVVLFGAESTGKTTLSGKLAKYNNGHWFYEWARPYLETVGPDITVDSMNAIWHGQRALQRHARQSFYDKPFHIYDTDLFSTVGYWKLPHWEPTLGMCPSGLISDAMALRADLYIICQSNIPFEEDPLRYGGDVRESDDQYWIDLAEHYQLPYVVLDSPFPTERYAQARRLIKESAKSKTASLTYDRGGF